MLGAMCKIHCTEMLFDCVYKCMQVVGVNSMDRKHSFDRWLREASLLPLYDAGNFGMQRRRVHGVMADSSFNPRAVMDDEAIEFTKAMEGIDTVPGHFGSPDGPHALPQQSAKGGSAAVMQ
jgi:acyl-CoA dehydrogenase